jgi:phospholipid/cholesterol/gamma-HCH transport system substrate-binding protein
MLLDKNHALIGLVVILVIGAGTLFAVGATAGLLVRGDRLEVELADAAGLKRGDFVFVAGYRAGEVLSVDIDEDIVRASFSLTAPEVPADSTASVFLFSTLGKRGLSITPGTATQHLTDGDVIPLSRSSTPVDLPELGDRATELLGGVDVEALQEVTTALADITDGIGDEVEALLSGIEDVSGIVSDRRQEIEDVLDRAYTLVDAAADKDAEIVAIIDDFGSVLERLVQRRADITRLLRQTASQSTATAALIGDNRAQLDEVLASFHEDLAIVDQHQVDLAHTFAYLGVSLEGFSSIGVSNGEARTDNAYWGNVFVTGLGAVGIGAAFDCGGALDELFTRTFGPDPRCEPVDNPSEGDGPPREPPRDDPLGPVDVPPVNLEQLLESLTQPLSSPESMSRFLQVPGGLLGGGEG